MWTCPDCWSIIQLHYTNKIISYKLYYLPRHSISQVYSCLFSFSRRSLIILVTGEPVRPADRSSRRCRAASARQATRARPAWAAHSDLPRPRVAAHPHHAQLSCSSRQRRWQSAFHVVMDIRYWCNVQASYLQAWILVMVLFAFGFIVYISIDPIGSLYCVPL